ncbi:unnamed protein product [Pocillopora meandrina]|uniref:Uncharacterized protein n=1 Tax=Pocillopora meandrina TaxID=46732 RepID=A0AAU9WLQ2_9CNID|nr:unnamed protein product [Pocillopora meandrina]
MRFFYRSSGLLASIMIISFVSLFESYLSDRTQYVNIDGSDVGKVAQWTADNKMVLNRSKAETMLVAGKCLHKKMNSTSLTVNVNSVELEQVQSHILLDQRILYYNAMIKQTILYGSSVWVSTPVDNLQATEAYRTRYSPC